MKFYRRLRPFNAISFDLDDTLYSNHPVMTTTDRHMADYFALQLSAHSCPYDHHYWFTYRQQVLADYPDLTHDVSALRLKTYYLGIQALGKSNKQANDLAVAAMNEFDFHRSNFKVPNTIHQLLSLLAEHCPLVAISNGNVDTKKIGLQSYFQHIYHADLSKQQKPSSAMFTLACQDLAIEPQQLLHVGDCGRNDIYGAILAGCQSAWVSTYDVGKPLSVLPTMELTRVEELQRLFM